MDDADKICLEEHEKSLEAAKARRIKREKENQAKRDKEE